MFFRSRWGANAVHAEFRDLRPPPPQPPLAADPDQRLVDDSGVGDGDPAVAEEWARARTALLFGLRRHAHPERTVKKSVSRRRREDNPKLALPQERQPALVPCLHVGHVPGQRRLGHGPAPAADEQRRAAGGAGMAPERLGQGRREVRRGAGGVLSALGSTACLNGNSMP
jgi:hypothetical protein